MRLMGLESSTAEEEKQRQVMEALEKCERDLKALKEFIDAFESTESFRSLSPAGEGKRIELMVLKQQEEGSPVAEELSWPWHLLNRHGFNNSMIFHRPSANSGTFFTLRKLLAFFCSYIIISILLLLLIIII